MVEKKYFQIFMMLVVAFLMGAANGIALCKFCWPVWKWIMGGAA